MMNTKPRFSITMGAGGHDEGQHAPQLPQGGAVFSPKRGERRNEFDPAAGSLDELMPRGAVRCRARTTDDAAASGPSTEMTAPALVSLASENTWLSMRGGNGQGQMGTAQVTQPPTGLRPAGRQELDRRVPRPA